MKLELFSSPCKSHYTYAFEFHLAFYCPVPLGCSLSAAQAVLVLNILNNCASSATFVTLLLGDFSKSCMNKLNSTDPSTDPSTGDFPLSQELVIYCSLPSPVFCQIIYPFHDLPIYENDHEVERRTSGVK